MQHIYIEQILFLTFQCVIVSILLLSLFRLRTIFGLSLLLTTLGVFQYMQVFLANTLYFEILPGFFVSSGSSILFAGSLFTILLVYIKEDALEARKLIYAILSANIVLTILQFTISLDFESEHILNIYNLPKELFSQSLRISSTGTILLFIDTFLIIFIYEAISKYTKLIFLKILISTTFILSIDSVIFALIGFYGTGQTERILIGSLISKNFAALIYSLIFILYIKYFENKVVIIDSKEHIFKDIFNSLTFRQKYESLYKENKIQKKELESVEMKYKYFVEQTSEGFYKMDSDKPIPINLPIDKQIKLIYKHFYVKECNNKYANLYGYAKSADMIGLRLIDLHGGDNIKENIQSITEFLQSNYKILDSYTVETDKNNNKCYFLNNAIGIIENNNFISFWGTQRDITDKRNIEIALNEANTIINRSPTVAFLWKNENKWPVEYVSENILNLCGYKSKEFIEQKISYSDLIHEDDLERVFSEVELASNDKTVDFFNHKPYRIKTKNNGYKWVRDVSYIRKNSTGEITHYEGIVYDITTIIETQNKLIVEKNKAQNYLTIAGVMLISIDTNGIVQLINPKGCEILGYKEEEILGKNWFDNFLPKNNLDEIKEVANLIFKGKQNQHKYYENNILTKQGEERLIAWNNEVIYDENGNITSTLSSGEDITERKELETALINEKTLLKAIIDNIPILITLYDPKINMLFLNKEFESKLGITAEEAAEIDIMEFFYPDENIRKQAAEHMLNAPNEWKEFPVKAKNGEIIESEWINIKLKNGTLIGIGIDITERKKTKLELNETKNILLNTLENMTDGFVSLDTNWHYNYVNKKAGELFGKTPENLINKHIWTEFPEGINQPFYINYYKALETQKPIIFEDYYAPWEQWFENRIIPSKDGLAIFFQNITERKNTEKELFEINNRLKILHDIDSAILNGNYPQEIAQEVLTKLNAIIPFGYASLIEFNPENETFKYISIHNTIKDVPLPTDIIKLSDYEFLKIEILVKGEIQIIEDLKSKKFTSKRFNKYIERGLHSLIIIPLVSNQILVGALSLLGDSMEIFSKNNLQIAKEIGNQLAIVIHQNKLKNEILEYTEGLEEKIVERTQQLEFSNKELRDFAQVVSHDLKAPLRAISQLSYWISQDYSDKIDKEGQEQFKMLINRVKRLDNLIEGILQYSRAGKAREKEIPIDLNIIVNEVIISLNPPQNIKIEIENELPKILGDPIRFSQVFQNLISNAITYIDKPMGNIKIGCLKQIDFWEFYVSDNGPGIEEKYFDRIFQIFQRLETRDNNEGTGVGLSLVKRIVQIYNGDIWVKSKINEGSTFYFTLPIKEKTNLL